MEGDAQQLAGACRPGYPVLAVDPYFTRRKRTPRCSTSRKSVKIGRPHRPDQVRLCEMAKQPVTDVRMSVPNLLLKKGTSVGGDRKASLNVKSVLLGSLLFRVTALP